MALHAPTTHPTPLRRLRAFRIFRNDSLDELDVRRLHVEHVPPALKQALELLREHVALEVERGRGGERAGDGFGEL